MRRNKRFTNATVRTRRQGVRTGAILFAALVCLVVVSLLLLGILRTLALDQRQVRAQRNQLQADFLAASGVERATAALRASAEYAGESWKIPASELAGVYDALVVIRVEKSEQAERRRLVSVQADYPADSVHRVRASTQTVVDL